MEKLDKLWQYLKLQSIVIDFGPKPEKAYQKSEKILKEIQKLLKKRLKERLKALEKSEVGRE